MRALRGGPRPPAFRWRRGLAILGLVILVLCLAILGGGWYYADALKDGALAVDHDPDELDLRVAAADGTRITLQRVSAARDGDWTRDGTFGLEWEGGYGRVGAILNRDGDQVVREFTAVRGVPPAGAPARLDSFAFAGNPLEARGIAFEDVSYSSPLGEFPAWFTPAYRPGRPGSGDVWAVFVHGKGAGREEALRLLPAVSGVGLPALVITYRNDEGVPEDGFYRYGASEWRDLDGAVQYALDHGARRVVLVGYSMGGGIVASFLYRSPLAGRVAGVILDSPMLDFAATVDWGARGSFAPWPVKAIGRAVAARRFDIDWGDLDYLKRAEELNAPILLFHGDADKKVPVATSDELARARPDTVTYVRVAGAGHVRSWNTNPRAYETAVRDFLLRVLE
ncbi:MAG: alpha/beta hydrolase [Dehalococcoidia bacterium]|nr:alpha/beta hydrolase [Dehalococcoidia bacterium]